MTRLLSIEKTLDRRINASIDVHFFTQLSEKLSDEEKKGILLSRSFMQDPSN